MAVYGSGDVFAGGDFATAGGATVNYNMGINNKPKMRDNTTC
jgi:hypothetical protein